MAEKLQLVKANNLFVSHAVNRGKRLAQAWLRDSAAGGCRGSDFNSAAVAPLATEWGKDRRIQTAHRKLFFFLNRVRV